MDLSTALDIGRHTLYLALLISAPILGIGLIVGLIISIVQAVTQLQEQTLVFVPKIVSMIVATAVFLPWIAQKLLDFSRNMFAAAPGDF
ncbi:MAG: flagellar biosynthesis protein FliQ [Phycisphaerae bacterium]